MNEWQIIWDQKEIFTYGLVTTVVLFSSASAISFFMGLALLSVLENGSSGLKFCVRSSINVMRTLPFLILAYLLYYGLPQVGIRMDAMTAGLVSLCLYHSTYFCEIFRGVRKDMDEGYIEAAKSCGFSKFKIFTRVITPNVLFKSIPLIANQLIICLKDTAFLSIITVSEITAAANSIQSTYFIPLNAFIVAIGLYWMVSIAVEQLTKLALSKVLQRGLSHA
ncbi:ABC transporter permease subunit [Vibrio sp. D404a]|uniref:amino acid ABC transporter permease n=1 Tax=unclassified Vibrio TaxID=2614977 RepID=UPI002552446F|nr:MULTISPECIES: ABC transporter permease subunit [unclassified Vibrio]MDK9735690.1 ABC transporter permease subunit [Vibrio sp. D404a]MDK9798606.1 ABC transporter permease subunit [Vibrio sp. D449a]